MRLSSRRNQYTRNTFYEIRTALTAASVSPSLPGFLRYAVKIILTITQQLEPAPVQQ